MRIRIGRSHSFPAAGLNGVSPCRYWEANPTRAHYSDDVVAEAVGAQGGSWFQEPDAEEGQHMEDALMRELGIGADIMYNAWASTGLCFTDGTIVLLDRWGY